MPPTIPFWFGEAPARSDELSRAVSDLRAEVERQLAAHDAPEPIVEWFATATGVSIDAAIQAVMYFAEARRALGVLPTQDTLVVERFFDEAGGMQLVLHAPFGSRVNKAWGLALRKRFCRQFNFELQAAATEDALLLSLGPQHSFPLADVFRYLHPATARDVLVQAFLDAPVFQTRWRWNTTISLAVPRNRSGRKVAPQIQRMLADDLLAAVFPDAAACLENIPGDRQIPDHPLVNQTVRDCLQEAMDFEALAQILGRIHRGEIRCIACDTPEPSVLAHDILNARPYAFLDDAPLEERRTQAVYSRRTTEPSTGSDLGALDPAAIERVRDEQAVDARDADELHDALMTGGFLSSSDVAEIPREFFDELIAARRATAVHPLSESNPSRAVWIAAERIPEYQAIHGNTVLSPCIEAPASRASRAWTREQAAVELLRGRLTLVGPTTARELAASLSISEADVDAALLALESEGAVLRGFFRTAVDSPRPLEWCDRRLLARIHRYTLDRLRSEIEPVSPAAFMRFLFSWQHVDEATSLLNVEGVRAAIAALDGFEVAAAAWEAAILPARVDRYDASMLDSLSLTGEIAWGRLSATSPSTEGGTRLVGTTPVALFLREHAEAWYALKHSTPSNQSAAESSLSDSARSVLETLRRRGASFAHELGARSGSGTRPTGVGYRSDTTPTGVGYRSDTGRSGVGHRSEWGRSGVGVGSDTGRNGVGYKSDTGRNGVGHVSDPDPVAAIAELAAAGLVTSDGFAGLRLLVRGGSTFRGGPAGRWSAISLDESTATRERAVEAWAWALLRRYGVVFRRLLTREPALAPWRELTRVYRRLEARGEIRGGRFVAGMSGEQFALPDAVERLREVRRTPPNGRLITISAADPLNLAGIVTAGERVRAAASTRMAFCDGVAIAVMEGDYIRQLAEIESDKIADVASALAGRRVPAVAAGYVGRY
jgi:ATP-dependent Lhr-like helicase